MGAEEAVRRVLVRVWVRYGNVEMEGGERVGLLKGGDDLWIGSGGKDGVEDEMGFGGHFRCLDSTEGRNEVKQGLRGREGECWHGMRI